MLEKVQEALKTSHTIPAPPATVPANPKHLMSAMQMLSGKINRLVDWCPAHSPWEDPKHTHDEVGKWLDSFGFEAPPPPPRISTRSTKSSPRGARGSVFHNVRDWLGLKHHAEGEALLGAGE